MAVLYNTVGLMFLGAIAAGLVAVVSIIWVIARLRLNWRVCSLAVVTPAAWAASYVLLVWDPVRAMWFFMD
jgi:hypothetical protein